MSSPALMGTRDPEAPHDPKSIKSAAHVWEPNDVHQKRESKTTPTAKRLLTIRIPRSRRPELSGIYSAKSASLWCIIIATLLIIAYFISQFCIPSLPGGLIGIILTLFSIYASTSLYRQQELFQARMNILYICILLIASGIILGFDAQKFAKLQSTSFPQGCLGANPNDKPDDLPTSCDRYYRLAIAGLLFMSIVCASFVGALISAIVLGGRLHAWKQAGTPNQIVSTTHYVIPPTAENIVMGGDQKRNIDRTTIAPSSLLPSPAIDDPPSNVSSRPLTPVELYHLTDFQLEKGMKRVGSKEMAEV